MPDRKSLFELKTKNLATRMRELANLEGFDVEVTDLFGAPVNLRTSGIARYDFDLPANGQSTVSEWKTNRFRRYYPQFNCRVLYSNGNEANGFTMLRVVRASYEED